MNVKPGDTFEDYLIWRLDLVVPLNGVTLVSLGVANTARSVTPRLRVSWKAFQGLVFHLSEVKGLAEELLSLFELDGGSWDSYHEREFLPLFDEDFEEASRRYLRSLKYN